jgi:hypothetical protein
MLITLQHRPQRIRIDEQGVALQFPEQAGLVGVMPLLGVDLQEPAQTADWRNGLPPQIVEQAQRANRLLKAIPVQAYESYTLHPTQGTIDLTYRYRFVQIDDDWSTPPLQAAPVPPAVALAAGGGMPLTFSPEPTDLKAPTYLGPNWVVPGSDHVTVQVPGVMELTTHVSVPDVTPADRRGNDEDAKLLAAIDDGLGGKTWDTGVGWWAGASVAMTQGDKAEFLPYVGEDMSRQIKAATMRLLHEMLFDGQDMIHPIIDEQRGRVYVVDWMNHFKRYAGDNEAPSSEILRGLFNYAFNTGDWTTIRTHWKFLQGVAVASYVKTTGPCSPGPTPEATPSTM